MSLTVCKFGGSSLSDWDRFEHVGGIVRSDPERKYIVVSAPGKRSDSDEKITDLLYQACDADTDLRTIILARIFQRYASIRDHLAPELDLEGEFRQIFHHLPYSRDYAASRGEYLCAKIFASYMKLPFVDAADLFFFDAQGNIDAVRTQGAIADKLAPMGSAVIPGFYGSGANGGIRTFSRGGSDISGAWIATALQADLYENWTDVDGLYTADPRIVNQPRRHRIVSLQQMHQLGRAGANVLHPSSLEPLKGSGIDTLLKNSFCPECEGTRITENFRGTVPCVTGRKELYMLPQPKEDVFCTPLLYEFPVPGATKVAAVNVFGLRGDAYDEIRQAINPLHIIHMQNHLQIIIPNDQYTSVVRRVHGYLTD